MSDLRSGKARGLIAVDQAPRDANGEQIGNPVVHVCLAVDDLIAKLDDMTQVARRKERTGVDEGWMQAVRELRNWIKEAT